MEALGRGRLLVVANDLLVYAAAIAQPTGIQRVGAGLATSLLADTTADAALVSVDSTGARHIEPQQAGIGTQPRRSARLAAPLLSLLARAPRKAQEAVRSRARALLAARAARSGTRIDVRPEDWFAVIGAPWIAPGTAAATIALKYRSGARLALLVHDLLPLTAPEWYADRQSGEARDDVASLVASADVIFAVSTSVAKEIGARFGRTAIALPPADPILPGTATVQPPSIARAGSTSVTTSPYILCVGTLHPRKRVAALVRAIATIAAKIGIEAAPRLVVAGRRHPQDRELFAELDALAATPGLRERVTLIHNADDAHLATLYAGCRFAVLPSLAEGWGIPVREALVAGRPVIATDAVPAAVGSPYVAIVPAGDDAALTGAIARWWSSDEPEKIAEQIRREFTPRSWDDVARELRAAIDQVPKGDSPRPIPR